MLIDEVGTKLAAVIGYTEGTNMFLGTLPALPDVCAAIFETGGSAPTYALGQAAPVFHNAGVQFVFRGAVNDYAGPRAVAKTAFDEFIGLQNITLPVDAPCVCWYYIFKPQQDPFSLEPDENGRIRIAFNMVLMKAPS